MTSDPAALYQALSSRDPRFDGVFYVGVTSTGIYCRPVCPARTPRETNCRFFESPEAAEKARFRPCLRCRPELAPGNAPMDDARRIAELVAQRIDEGMLDQGAGLERIAARFGWSSRQIRRIVQRELGVSPIELVLTRRLLLAKQLLTETSLPITQVAFASGFASLRRFNDAFGRRYGMPPTRLRRSAAVGMPHANAMPHASDAPGMPVTPVTSGAAYATDAASAHPTFTLRLGYRAPYDWAGMLRFLGTRALLGVERVDEHGYWRTVQLGLHSGWIRVRNAPNRAELLVELTHTLTPVLPALLGRVRHLFDLSARPDLIAAQLAQDPRLAGAVERNPGLRVPGAFDGFELALRAILGQQITVAAATTLAGRLVGAFGTTMAGGHEDVTRLAPTAAQLSAVSVDGLVSLGIVRTRARSIIGLATEVASGRLHLDPGADAERTMAQLVALPGIGPWTAHYIAMRALRWPDAFPKEDVVVRRALGNVTAAEAEVRSQPWRPWRSYATLHLWREAADGAVLR